MSSLQGLRPDSWFRTPRQQQSGGAANGMYSAQVTGRNPSGRANYNFTPRIPGLGTPASGIAGSPPGGPQPGGGPTWTPTMPNNPAAMPSAPAGRAFTAPVWNNYSTYDPTRGAIDVYAPGWDVVGTMANGQYENPLSLGGFNQASLNAMSDSDRQALLDQISQAASKRIVLNYGQNLYRNPLLGDVVDANGLPTNRTQQQLNSYYDPTSANTLGPEAVQIAQYLLSGGTPIAPPEVNNPNSPDSPSFPGGTPPFGGGDVGIPGAPYNPNNPNNSGPRANATGGFNYDPNNPIGSIFGPATDFLNSIANSYGGGSVASGAGGAGGVGGASAPGIRQLYSSLLNGDIFGVPSSSQDYGSLRSLLQNYLSGSLPGINAGQPAAPPYNTISNAGTDTQSLDQLGGANSPFFLNMMSKYEPLFQQERARALAEANESAGNLVGSGHANILGNALGRTLTDQQARIADLVNQQISSEQNRQGQAAQLAAARNTAQAQLNQQRDLGVFGSAGDINNANAGRIAALLGSLGTAGVSPDEIVSQGGLGSLIGPLLGALGNSSLGSGLASLGGSLASGLGSLGSSFLGSLGSLGESIAKGIGSGVGSLGDIFKDIFGKILDSGGKAAGAVGQQLYDELKPIADNLGADFSTFISAIGSIPGLDKILEGIGQGATTVLQPILDYLKKIPGLGSIDVMSVYSILKLLSKYGVIRGTGGQILNAMPGYGNPGFGSPTYRPPTGGPTYGGPGRPGYGY